jgi:hypothetical protein
MPVTPDQVRALALALPGATEQDHHGRPSFRVRGKIFATQWDPGHANLMLDEPGILTAAEAHSQSCAPFLWGKRVAALHVTLAAVDAVLLADLLRDAWERKAPRDLLGAR